MTPEEIASLELYLVAVPEAVRLSLKRPDDLAGTTVPAGFRLDGVDDVMKLLPARPPRFRAGSDLPGKPGWVLERLLGIGGFGEVWYARHSSMSSLCGAVKFCLGQSGKDLIHEAVLIDRVLSAGRHPNIVPLVDAHLESDTPWLLFEYVGGGNLTDWIHRLAGLSREDRCRRALTALRQLAGAVEFFHDQKPPIVHRDLKPSNILLGAGDTPRITDFGIGAVTAREVLRQESRGQSSRGGWLLTYLRGSHTPLYASPQQREGHDPDPRDDMHAMGVIGYQMLTGHLAQGAGPDFADDLRDAGASEEMIALLGRCVAQKPERRPKDARELLHLLNKVGTNEDRDPTSVPSKKPSSAAVSPNEAEGAFAEGMKYLFGQGVAKDDALASEFFRKAADQDHAVAQCNLAWMYQNGQGVQRDDARAVGLYRKAAHQGNADGQYNLGLMYANGCGVMDDKAMAAELFRKAADQGNAGAQCYLGTMYDDGVGVEKDDAMAAELYGKAAAQGYAAAQYYPGAKEDH